MQSASIIILFWIYAIAMTGFVKIFLLPLQINMSPFYLSLVLSIVGILLGFLFYGLSLLKKSLKTTIVIGIMVSILFIVLFTYLIAGLNALIELFILLIEIGFFLLMCTIPIIGVYSILTKQRNVLISSGAGMMFFYFFVIILSKLNSDFSAQYYSEDQITMLLLFFLLFVSYLEVGATSIYFGSVVNKMTPNEDSDEAMLLQFNQVFNRYIIQISIILILCYFLSIFLFWYKDNIGTEEFMGVDLSSPIGIFLMIVLFIAGAFVFWYLIPREKTEFA